MQTLLKDDLRPGGQEVEILEEALARIGSYRLRFTRDSTDSFVVKLDPVGEIPPGTELTKSLVLPLLPQGSRWEKSLGWWSVVGLPLATQGGVWYCVGIERVRHHETRGAFPELDAIIVPQSKIRDLPLSALADGLHKPRPGIRYPCRSGIVVGRWQSMDEYTVTAAYVLRRAQVCLQSHWLTLFRTAVLSEDQLAGFLRIGSTLPRTRRVGAGIANLFRGGREGGHTSRVIKKEYVLGIPEPLRSSLPTMVKVWVRATRDTDVPDEFTEPTIGDP